MQRHEILDRIDSPADLKKLDAGSLNRLCGEIREEIADLRQLLALYHSGAVSPKKPDTK